LIYETGSIIKKVTERNLKEIPLADMFAVLKRFVSSIDSAVILSLWPEPFFKAQVIIKPDGIYLLKNGLSGKVGFLPHDDNPPFATFEQRYAFQYGVLLKSIISVNKENPNILFRLDDSRALSYFVKSEISIKITSTGGAGIRIAERIMFETINSFIEKEYLKSVSAGISPVYPDKKYIDRLNNSLLLPATTFNDMILEITDIFNFELGKLQEYLYQEPSKEYEIKMTNQALIDAYMHFRAKLSALKPPEQYLALLSGIDFLKYMMSLSDATYESLKPVYDELRAV